MKEQYDDLPYRQDEIDADILSLVNALNLSGIPTVGSCSGHGKEHGYIILKDERTLVILSAPFDKDYVTRELQFNQSIRLKEESEMNNPTQGQIKEFWEWCGFRCRDFNLWTDPSGKIRLARHALAMPVELDLNNLFKYAVDEAVNDIMNENGQLYSDEDLWYLFDIWVQLMEWYDTEIALFWALWQVRRNPR